MVQVDPGVPAVIVPLIPDAPHPLTVLNVYSLFADPGIVDWKVYRICDPGVAGIVAGNCEQA